MLVFCKYLCKKDKERERRSSKLITGRDNILRCHIKWARKFQKSLKIKKLYCVKEKLKIKQINQKMSPCHEKLSAMSVR